jgi:hypothetical protein
VRPSSPPRVHVVHFHHLYTSISTSLHRLLPNTSLLQLSNMTKDYEDEPSSSLTTLIDEEKFKSYNDIHPSVSKLHFLRRYKLSLTILSLIIFLTPLLYIITKAAAPYNQCGTTPTEARRRGCVFETTGFAWLPRACLDPTIEAQFLAHITKHNVTYYRDQDCTQRVSLTEVQRGDEGFFVQETYHKTHCAFLLRKLHSAFCEGKPVDGMIMNQGHTKHCVGEMLDGEMMHMGANGQFSYLKYPYCGKMGGYNLGWPEQGTWS